MGGGGSLGLFHKSQRQALSDIPDKRKALVKFLSLTAMYKEENHPVFSTLSPMLKKHCIK